MLDHTQQIAPVGDKRVAGHVALKPQMAQEPLRGLLQRGFGAKNVEARRLRGRGGKGLWRRQ
jgi:hypothetical protein